MPDPHAGNRRVPAKPGDHVGNYDILGELGRGGMGVVYRARDRVLNREVALKCPWPDRMARPDILGRFLREGRVAARLSHPNIVPLFEVFEENGLPWLAMQLVDGETLRAALDRDGSLPMAAVIRYATHVVSALETAHESNVLHRDINPNNVMITRADHALLTDFGLARFMEPEKSEPEDVTAALTLTTEGAILGTLHFMSPEQALGRKLDVRSDLFSLGSVLYEMATGCRPFTGRERGDVLEALIRNEPEAPSSLTPEVPPEFDRIVAKAMAKKPDERYQHTRDLMADLRALRRKLEFSEYSQSGENTERSGAPSSRRRPWAWIAALAVVPLLAGVFWFVFLRSADTAVPRASSTPVTSDHGWEGHPAISPDGSRIAYVAEQNGNRDIFVINVTGGEPIRLTRDASVDEDPAWFPDGTAILFSSNRAGAYSIWRMGQFGEGQTLWMENGYGPAISPDGSRVAFARGGPEGINRIAVAPMDAPEAWRFLTDESLGADDHAEPAWSPDGNAITFSNERDIWTVPAEGGEPTRLTRLSAYLSSPEWSPSGSHIYFSGYLDPNLALWRVAAGGGEPERITQGMSGETHPSLSRDGTRVAYATEQTNHDIVVRDMTTGIESRLEELRDDWMPVLSPDGATLVFVSDRGGSSLNLWGQDLENGALKGKPRRLTQLQGEVSYPAFSPDGAWIAFYTIEAGDDGAEVRDIWTVASRGSQPQRLTSHSASEVHPAWSPDGNHIAFVRDEAGTTALWVVPVRDGRASGEPRRVGGSEATPLNPAWSPDSQSLAFVGNREGGGSEVWVIDVDGASPARAVTRDADARRIRWLEPGFLLVSGRWDVDRNELRRVPLDGQAQVDSLAVLGPLTPYCGFDMSTDGRLLAFTRAYLRGDIWVLTTDQGSY